MSDGIRLPTNSQRLIATGRTGTGKTVCLLWHLSNYDLTRPWLMINFKGDEHIDSIEGAEHVDLDFKPDKKSRGLYVINPLPHEGESIRGEQSPVEKLLWRVWEREDMGILCDECHMVANKAFNACLTQGRSKRIPMLMGAQRPVWVPRFAFSEADFIQAFHLNDERDRETVETFTPIDSEDFDSLGEFESYYFDVGKNKLVQLRPVPNMDQIRARLAVKVPRKRVLI